jgi:hypothetical protein
MTNKCKLCGTINIDHGAIHSNEIHVLSVKDLGEIAPNDRWIIFWEDPIRMIFRKNEDPATTSSEDLLQQWMKSASGILKAVRRHRKQISIINFAEAQERPKAFIDFCDKELGVQASIKESETILLEEFIPIFQKLSQENVRELLSLLQELEASGVTLDSTLDIAYSNRALSPAAIYAAIDLLKKSEFDGVPKEELQLERDTVAVLQNEAEEKKKLLVQKDDELKQSEEKALQNYEMLLAELHEAFKESEGYFEQWKKAESAGRGLLLKVDSLSRGGVVDHGTHRHLDYTLSGVDLLGRSWPTLRVRLIRHNGRPGILLFEAGTAPFYAWEPSGQEGGVNFMLFVPSDAPIRDYLVRAAASDLLMIRDSVASLLSDLKMNGLPEGAFTDWTSVAESLLQQFNEIPERLHYDSVQSKLEGDSINLEICNASFRNHFYPLLRVAWKTDSGKVTIFPDENCRPIFSGWPVDEQGRNSATCELFNPDALVEGRPCVPLTEHDRAFLSVLVGEIPNFLVHAAKQHPKEAGRLASFKGRARGLRKKVLKLKSL